MSDNMAPTFTIQVGVAGTFSWDPYGDISSYLNDQIALAPPGDNIVIEIEPGTYGVVKPILLPSNTSVVGNDATLQPLAYPGWEGNTGIFVNADAYSLNSTETYVENTDGTSETLTNTPTTTTVMDPIKTGVIDKNISVQGLTFRDNGYWIFGTWFTNATDIDVQDNTYIGGPDGNAFVDVTNAIVANNIAVGQVNAAYDNWDGPTNVTIEDNSSYISGTPNSGWSFLINSCPSGNPANPGDAVNDGVVGNLFSGYWVNGSSGNADPLEAYGFTTESDITQQSNIISSLNVPEAGSSYSANVVSRDLIEDDLFSGTNYPSVDQSFVISALSNSASLASNGEILGNLILGPYDDDNGAALIVNIGNSPTTSNNAILGSGLNGGSILTNGLNGTSSSSGNIVMNGTSPGGAGVIPEIDIVAPPNVFLSPGSSLELVGLSINDLVPGDELAVTLSAIFGTLELPIDPQGTLTTNASENNLTLTGNLQQVNSDLASLSYTSTADGWDDSIEVNVSGPSGLFATRYIPVLVTTTETSSGQLTILPAGFMGTLTAEGTLFPGTYLLPEPSLNGEIAIASSGNNFINLGSSISAAFLGSGSDTVESGSGSAYIASGAGNAFINLAGTGDITVAAGAGALNVDAATGNNLIESGSSTAIITAGSGSNTVAGGTGQVSVLGGTGSLYVVSLPQDGGEMDLTLGTGASTVLALSGNSSISTQPDTSNLIFCGIGNALVESSGSDTIYTGAGSSTVYASSSATDDVVQGTGPLTFVAPVGASVIFSAGGNLTVEDPSPNLSLQIGPQVGSDRTIALDGLQASVSLDSGLSVKAQSIEGQNLSLTLSDGTHLEIVDPQHYEVIDQSGQLSFATNILSLSSNTFLDLTSNYQDGANWSIIGSSIGTDTINVAVPNTSVTTFGADNVAGLIGLSETISSEGNSDLLVGFGGNDVFSVDGHSSSVLTRGGADTVYAGSDCSSLNMFFVGLGGGQLDFINSSSNAASVTGGADGASGSVTTFGGAGGGYYQGGDSGNNFLIGGSGSSATTLIGGGGNDFLSVGGSGSNALFSSNGNTTLIAGAGTSSNIFAIGGGTDVVSSEGSANQAYFFGDFGSTSIYSSTVAGAVNGFFFDQSSANGGGTAVIFNFDFTRDSVNINPNSGGDASSVTVSAVADWDDRTTISLSNNTLIILVGTTLTSTEQLALLGSSQF